jgi:hypothetical protein
MNSHLQHSRQSSHNIQYHFNHMAQRTLDIVLASLMLAAAAPVMIVVALLVKFDSPGPVLYSQTRVGLNRRKGERRAARHSDAKPDRRLSASYGKPFPILKFRSMRTDAEKHAEEDKKRRGDVEALNMADALVFESEKILPEFEGKVDAGHITAIREKRESLKALLAEKDRDPAKVKAALDALQKALSDASVEMYQRVQPQGGAQGATGGDGHAKSRRHGDAEGDVVDADFKVDEDKK